MRTAFYAMLFLAGLYAPAAKACGHCVEDKIAAVYDHAVITRARNLHQHVAYVAIEGTLVNDIKTRSGITGMLRTVKGIDASSVRVSLELAAFSYAYDPKREGAIQRSIERRLSRMGLRTTEMKILAKPGGSNKPS
jgi:hypothetical protein